MATPPRPAPTMVLDGPLPLCRGYQQITDLSSATALTVPAGSTMALIQCEAVDVRYRADGTNPTSSVGMLITAGREVLYPTSESALGALRFIRTAAGSILNVHYY